MKKRGPLKASVEMFKEAAEVGERLRHMREVDGLSQSVVARELGISRERLANYEDGRTPLKVEVGLLACRQFIYSEKWLATGEGDRRQFVDVAQSPAGAQLKPGTFYAQAFRDLLAAEYEKIVTRNPFDVPLPSMGTDPGRDARLLKDFLLEWYTLLGYRSGDTAILMCDLIACGMDFCARNVSRVDLEDPSFLELSDVRDSVAFVGPTIRKAHARAVVRRLKKAGFLDKKGAPGE